MAIYSYAPAQLWPQCYRIGTDCACLHTHPLTRAPCVLVHLRVRWPAWHVSTRQPPFCQGGPFLLGAVVTRYKLAADKKLVWDKEDNNERRPF